ncbi:hypothetical protein BcepF1.040 [Burkholderia phage BcepF1]|uniref:Uncharacterized protein n=1 Tax=Burkholderia phage BcepF1 TaxID=2886897 RepID=A1YZU4_9CAUD|nr:hypothetical protein BcepF1.040 [Burkholderia phage BcepF1]ABL96771.1 hypothetical protein BcepF1.040 [Burkholderia phage BcepF1]
MMKSPNLIQADDLRTQNMSANLKGRWVSCRPIAVPATPRIFARFILAWGVFVGKYDALKWFEQ